MAVEVRHKMVGNDHLAHGASEVRHAQRLPGFKVSAMEVAPLRHSEGGKHVAAGMSSVSDVTKVGHVE